MPGQPRQKNVAQQNDADEERIRASASRWREAGWPTALRHTAISRGVDCGRAIVVELEMDFPGMPRLFGLLLTDAGQFIRFEIETDASHDRIDAVEVWEDVSVHQNLSEHNPGTGWGRGAIALKVLRELNGDAQFAVGVESLFHGDASS